ncbi:transposase [Parasedimentitalea psychrophila]|uniref:Transposase n=1 Tax=Parasedimentitalea psychrophila TaxID=2997337 RepID=A0A9Y2L0J1_9RHOB|nr:transposase [Parasedimentitalea psychrophila]WIY25162.1 transposase [Parasedimentitalea psychrophila]
MLHIWGSALTHPPHIHMIGPGQWIQAVSTCSA